MRRRRVRLKQLLVFSAADLCGVLLGLLAAYELRFHAGVVEVSKAYSPQSYLRILPLAGIVWLAWLHNTGCYDFGERAFNLQILKKVVRASALAVMTIIAIHFFARSNEYSRLIYPLALLTASTGVGAARLVLDRVLARLRRAGKLRSAPVLILGTGTLGATIAERIRNHAFLGLSVKGFVSVCPEEVGSFVADFPVLGEFRGIRELIREHHISEIIVAEPDLSPQEILDFVMECEKEIASIRVVPNLLQAMLVEMSVEQIDGIPLFGLKESPLQGWNIILKRAFDIVAGVIGLVLLSPLLLGIAAAVKLSSPGPVFFKQKRVGLDGRRFHILKFRSMYVGAEKNTGPVWAVENDPRVTPLGGFLRRYSLDELPQILNVLRGDMSLVGPRPERPFFVRQFREDIPRYMGRHRVKSGMTGWAQVNGFRGNTSIDERVKYDLYYVENWSLWLDMKILLLTMRAAHKNAY